MLGVKRETLYRCLNAVGAFRLWRRLYARQLLVLNYHRIIDEVHCFPFDTGVVSCTPSQFCRHLEIISEFRNFIRVEELIEALNHGKRLPPASTLLTFDDGYVDNYTNALPILRQFAAPACFFVPVERLETRRLEWWDEISGIVNRAAPNLYELPLADSSTVICELSETADRRDVISRLIEAFKAGETDVDAIAETFQAEPHDANDHSQHIMSDEQIRDLVSIDGYSIGGHSVTHRVLAQLSPAEQEQEIGQSKERLEERFNTTVTAFAYPVGGESDYTPDSRRIVRDTGYKCAFNFRVDASLVDLEQIDRFDIDRVCLPASEESTILARASGFDIV